MDQIFQIVLQKLRENEISFYEEFYLSKDNKTILGEVALLEILFLDYRDTEAGSNPREYQGLKKTNEKILNSLLHNYKYKFRFLHSGIIISITDPIIDKNKKSIRYSSCCLTNGNQTRFIVLILTLLKLLNKPLEVISKEDYNNFIEKMFSKEPNASRVIPYLKYQRIKEIIDYLLKYKNSLHEFNALNIREFLNSTIRIQVNLIDAIVQEYDSEWDENSAGTLIAEANNDTQKVQAGDLFGNRYKKILDSAIFKYFKEQYGDKIQIEYRADEIIDKGEKKEKVHILTLLRPVVATGMFNSDKEVFTLTNQLTPIYSIFNKVLNKEKSGNSTEVVSKLIPFLYKLRFEIVKPVLERHKTSLIMKYKEMALKGELSNTIIRNEVDKYKDNDQKLEQIIKKAVTSNIEHILPVLVFRIRKLIMEKEGTNELKLNLSDKRLKDFLKKLIEVINDKYVKYKIAESSSQYISSFVRRDEFYEFGNEAYEAFKITYKFEETDYLQKHKINIH